MAPNTVRTIYFDTDGVAWFGTFSGVSRYDSMTFVNLTTKDGLAHDHVYDIQHGEPEGVMWFGTQEGVSRYAPRETGAHRVSSLRDGLRDDGKTFVNFTVGDGLVNPTVNVIHRDDVDGVMWFGTEGGVSRHDGNSFVNFTRFC